MKQLAGLTIACLCLADPYSALGVEPACAPVGGPLEESTIDFYVPPTRSVDIYAATATDVYQFASDDGQWKNLLTVPAGSGRFLGIAGYSKSSEVLYAVHSGGVQVTGDGGTSWRDSVPDGFATQAEEFVDIAVNPSERREAILATRSALWRTTDFGASWMAVSVRGLSERVSSIQFAGGDAPVAVLTGQTRVWDSRDGGGTWSLLREGLAPPVLTAASSESAHAVVAGSDGNVCEYDFERPGVLERHIQLPANPTAVALDATRLGAMWIASADGISLYSLRDLSPAASQVFEMKASPALLYAHPRDSQALLWLTGNQIYRLDGALGPQADAPQAAIPETLYTPLGTMSLPESIDSILQDLAGSEPSVHEAVAAALRYANYEDKDIAQWKKNVRRRNWLPEVSVEVGEREYPADSWGIASNVDRFGIRKPDDLHFSDRVEQFDRYGVELRWELGTLLFDRDQVLISEEARMRADDRNEVIKEVTQIYYDRLQLLIEQRQQKPASERKAIELQLKIAEMTELLNMLCGRTLFSYE